MPLRDYKCKDCGTVEEHFIASFHNTQPVKCNSCGSLNTFVFFGNHRLHFNGFGQVRDLDGSMITTEEVDKRCKETGSHFMSQAEQERTTKFYRRQHEQEKKKNLDKQIKKEMKNLQQKGVFS